MAPLRPSRRVRVSPAKTRATRAIQVSDALRFTTLEMVCPARSDAGLPKTGPVSP